MEQAVSETGLGTGRPMITAQVKIAVVFIAAACGTVTASWGQQAAQKPSVATLLSELHSKVESKRAKAFEQLRSDPTNLKNSEVRGALLDLLDRENHELDSQLMEAQKKGYPDEGDNGGRAEYYTDLLGVVDSFADWNDPQQACILVDASSSDDSVFAEEIADHAKVAIPCLIKRSESEISMNRAVTVPVLVRALAKAKDSVDPGTAQQVRQIVVAALNDPDESVRAFTVHALSKFGGEDMIAPLKKVAEADPSPEAHGHSIRISAAEAIVAIQKRAAQH